MGKRVSKRPFSMNILHGSDCKESRSIAILAQSGWSLLVDYHPSFATPKRRGSKYIVANRKLDAPPCIEICLPFCHESLH